jgi:excisionase family DNA binding protein
MFQENLPESLPKDEILTIAEVAAELRCSKAHVHNAINGKLSGVTPLPAIPMGRRRLVRRSALERWKRANERCIANGMIAPSSEVDAVRRMKEEFHA